VTITVQAPQSPSLQPSLVPVSPRISRSQSRRVRVGRLPAATRTGVPFRRNAISVMLRTRRLLPVRVLRGRPMRRKAGHAPLGCSPFSMLQSMKRGAGFGKASLAFL
jgi:hypothetical protein